MSAASPDDARLAPRSAAVPVSPAFLARLIRWTGGVGGSLPVAMAAARESGEAAAWEERLEAACRPTGLRVQRVRLSVRRLRDATATGSALVLWSERRGWVSVLAATPRKLRVHEDGSVDVWIRPKELAERLGVADLDAPLGWLAIHSGLSSASASSRPNDKLPPFRRLVELLRPERNDMLTIVLYAAFVGLLTLATPIAVQQLVNTVAFGGLVQPVVVLALLLFTGLAFSALLSVFQAVLAELIQRRVFVRACVDLADRLPRVPVGAYDDRHGPELVNRFFDLVTLQKSGATLLLDGTSVLLQTFAGLLVLSFYHPLMLGFSVLLLLSIAIVVLLFARHGTRTAIDESNAKYELASWMEELARHGGAFRGANGRYYAVARADALAAAWVESRRRHYRIVLRQIAASLGLQVVVSTLVLGLGGFLVVSGQMTLGQLVASEIIVAAVVAAFARFGKQFESFYDLLAAVDKIGTLLDLPLERFGGRPPARARGPMRVEANDVGFSYEGQSVLAGVSLVAEPGQRLAIVGRAASGKSTLVDLLCGLRSPTTGYVSLDGEDLRDLRLDVVRDAVTCVREPEIFPGSIAENVSIGGRVTSSSEVRDALERVGLLDEVLALPRGLHTPLSSDGRPLSRSQVARVMLARAVAARPRVLAIDGALTHLDAAARAVAADALFADDAPWTLLIVSTHEDVLERCDRRFRLPPHADEPEVRNPAPGEGSSTEVRG